MANSLQEAVEALQDTMEELESDGHDDPEPLNSFVRRVARSAGIYPLPNLAVDVCSAAFTKAIQEMLEEGCRNLKRPALAGKLAYCIALPRFSDSDSIRDFIACIVYAMATDIIPGAEGTRLLYGAQVAQTALPPRKRHKKHAKSAQNAPGNDPTTSSQSTT